MSLLQKGGDLSCNLPSIMSPCSLCPLLLPPLPRPPFPLLYLTQIILLFWLPAYWLFPPTAQIPQKQSVYVLCSLHFSSAKNNSWPVKVGCYSLNNGHHFIKALFIFPTCLLVEMAEERDLKIIVLEDTQIL